MILGVFEKYMTRVHSQRKCATDKLPITAEQGRYIYQLNHGSHCSNHLTM